MSVINTLTQSMQQNPSWEANSHSASQEVLCFFFNWAPCYEGVL